MQSNGARKADQPLPKVQKRLLEGSQFFSLVLFYSLLNPYSASANPNGTSEIDSTTANTNTTGQDQSITSPNPLGVHLLDSIYSDYIEVVHLLARTTNTSFSSIDKSLRKWANTGNPRMTASQLASFLAHWYLTLGQSPHRNWNVEFHNIRIIAQSNYHFWGNEVFLAKDPIPTQSNPEDARIFQTESNHRGFMGSFKKVYRIRLTHQMDDDPRNYVIIAPRTKYSPYDSAEEQEFKAHYYRKAAHDEIWLLRKIHELTKTPVIPGIMPIERAETEHHSRGTYIIAPYFNQGDARSWIKRNRGSLTSADLLQFAKQVLSGVRFLHAHGFAHRDIKPENMLVDHPRAPSPIRAVLSDFGAAYWSDDPNEMKRVNSETDVVTTYRYAAPEAVEQILLKNFAQNSESLDQEWRIVQEQYNLPKDLKLRWNPSWTRFDTDRTSDLWSIGISLLEIGSAGSLKAKNWTTLTQEQQTRATDFLGVTQEQVDQSLSQFRELLVGHPELEPLRLAVDCLLRVNPAERCTADQAWTTLHLNSPKSLPGVEPLSESHSGYSQLSQDFKNLHNFQLLQPLQGHLNPIIWSGPVAQPMNAAAAETFCLKNGGRLPSQGELVLLQRALGGRGIPSHADAAWKPEGYQIRHLPHLENHRIWTIPSQYSTIDPLSVAQQTYEWTTNYFNNWIEKKSILAQFSPLPPPPPLQIYYYFEANDGTFHAKVAHHTENILASVLCVQQKNSD